VRCLKRNNWRRWKLKQMFGNTIPTIRSLIAAPVPPRHSMTVGGPAPLQSRAPRPGPRWRLAPGSPPQTPRGGAQPNRAPRIGRRIGPQEAQRGGSGPLTSHPERPSLNERPGRDADVGEGHLGVVALLPEHGHRAHHPHAAGGAVRRGGATPSHTLSLRGVLVCRARWGQLRDGDRKSVCLFERCGARVGDENPSGTTSGAILVSKWALGTRFFYKLTHYS